MKIKITKEKLVEVLNWLLRVLKIAISVIAFILGLLGEGAAVLDSDPTDDPAASELLASLPVSTLGLAVNAMLGTPLMYLLGACVGQ